MPVRDHYRNVPKTVRAQIVTVDTRTRQIEAQLKDIGIVPVVVWDLPVAFRWPVEGEWWTLNYNNGYWSLGSIMQGDQTIDGEDQPARVEDLQPGDLKLHSENIIDGVGRQLVAVDGTPTDGQVPTWDGTMGQYIPADMGTTALPAWTPIDTLLLNNNGSNQGWFPNGQPFPGMYKRDGRVYFTGLVELTLGTPAATVGKDGWDFTNIIAGTVIPSQFRPNCLQRFWVDKDIGGGDGPPARFQLYITPEGAIYFDNQHDGGFNGCAALPLGNNADITIILSNINYRTDGLP